MTINVETQNIGMTAIQNARELGGYPTSDGRTVKRGVLLRTAKPSAGNEADFKRLTEVYHLAKMIDLRSEQEINGSPELAVFTHTTEPDPDPVLDGVENIHLPILDLDAMMRSNAELLNDEESMKDLDIVKMLSISIKAGFINDELYFGFLDEEKGRNGYSRMFRELLSLGEGEAVLFHCTQGKDRTGVAAMLILSALGVDEDVIIRDYLLTNDFNSERIEKERMMLIATGKVPEDQIDTFLMAMDRVNEKTMTNVIAHLKERCGSVVDYIKNKLGVTDSELEALRDKFLTEG